MDEKIINAKLNENKNLKATISYTNSISGNLAERGPQGPKGNPGKDAEITEVTASVTNTAGIPYVEVTLGGEPTERTIDFAFSNLKGEKGDKGDAGTNEWGSITGNIENQTDLINLLDGMEGSISALIGGKLDTDLSNITEAGKEVIKENSGAGLEVGDVAFTQGAIDETKGLRRVLNGSVVTRNSNTQGLFDWFTASVAQNPDMATTESEWQSENTANGMCGKFVYTAESTTNSATLRLPNYPKYFIGNIAATAPVVGNGMTLGLTNGSALCGTAQRGSDSALCLYPDNYGDAFGVERSGSNLVATKTVGLTTDPTKSGIEAQIKQEKIAGTYFIQIATGQETEVNITNEIELNNPFFFGMYQYFDSKPNNLSWLKSAGQWNSKAVYPDYYNWLLQEKNNPSTLPADTANVEITGSLINNNGVLSGFSESNYAFTPFAPEQPVTSYEMVAKFTSGDFSTSQQGILANGAENMTCPQIVLNEDENDAFALYFAHSTSSSWIAAGQVIIQPNTPYWAKMVWDGENVTSYYKTSESAEYIQVGTAPATSVYWTEKVSIGNDGGTLPLQNGSIDLNGCYININGSRWWSGMSNGVKYSTEDYTDYDYVINTTDETFRLPVKTKTPSGKAVVGNGKALTLLNNSTEYGLSGFSSTNYLTAYSGFVNRDVGGTGSNGSIMPTGIRAIGVTTDPENSGLELSDGDLYLYYYVGETVQNANLINAGRIEEKLVGKVDYANTQWAVNACMPDYSAGVEVAQLYTANSSYTAPCDGVIVFNAFKASSTLELYINGVASGYVLPAEPQWASNRNSATIPLSKGDVIYSSVSAASSSSRRSMFYPLKGAK